MTRADYYLRLPYTIHIVPDQYPSGATCYFAQAVELPGCESHGDTPEEAESNLRDAIAEYITSLIDMGVEPPVPTQEGAFVVWRSSPTLETPVLEPARTTPYAGGLQRA